jgi:hypothetical protein
LGHPETEEGSNLARVEVGKRSGKAIEIRVGGLSVVLPHFYAKLDTAFESANDSLANVVPLQSAVTAPKVWHRYGVDATLSVGRSKLLEPFVDVAEPTWHSPSVFRWEAQDSVARLDVTVFPEPEYSGLE